MQATKNKLAVIVLGKRNAGKSSTWYEIFGRTIRSGWKPLRLSGAVRPVYLQNSSPEEAGIEINKEVFVRNSSFEEAGDEAEDYFDTLSLPAIVFCSVQYVEKGIRTINWFRDHGYYLYIHWLNPGYWGEEYDDYLKFEEKFKANGCFLKCSGKEKAMRAQQIRDFLYDWVRKQ